jgi:hypothetical protein
MATKTKTPRSQPKITASSPGDWLWDLFKDYQEPEIIKQTFPSMQLLVVVAGTCYPPRHEKWDYIKDWGHGDIEDVLTHKKGLPKGDLMFVFPDNFMIPVESRLFVYRLARHPDIVNEPRRRVLIVTNQPYIVGDCRREQVRLLKDGEQHINMVRSWESE